MFTLVFTFLVLVTHPSTLNQENLPLTKGVIRDFKRVSSLTPSANFFHGLAVVYSNRLINHK